MRQGLFRQEVVDRQSERLKGDVFVMPKIPHTAILVGLVIWLVVAVIWVSTSKYASKARTLGWLEPPGGVVRVYAPANGTVQRIYIQEGEAVREGQPLIVVGSDRALANGEAMGEVLEGRLQEQADLLRSQLALVDEGSRLKAAKLLEQSASAQRDLDSLNEQLVLLKERGTLVAAKEKRFQDLYATGHVSQAILADARDARLALEAESQALKRSVNEQEAALSQLHSDQRLLPSEADAEASRIRAQLSEVLQKMAEQQGERRYVIRATRDGTVSNLQSREGGAANPQTPLLAIVPADAALVAHLFVPVRASGFIAAGQAVEIRYDAYPYQKFGLYPGHVTAVSQSVLLPDDAPSSPIAVQEPVYQVTVALGSQDVSAYGQRMPVRPGMTLSADIVLERRSLLEWMFEPILSIGRYAH